MGKKTKQKQEDYIKKEKTKDELIKEINKLNKQIEKEKSLKENTKNEEYYKLLYELMPFGYQSLDANDRITDVNQSWLEILGYTREEVIGKWLGDFLAPEFIDDFREKFELFKTTGKCQSNYNMLHKNGTVKNIKLDGRISCNTDGSFKQIHCIFFDDIEHKQTEDILRESENQYKELIDGMIDTVWIIDFDGNLLDVNKTAVDVLGYSKEELLSIGIFGIDYLSNKKEIRSLAESMPIDKVQKFESMHKTKDGRVFPVEIYSSLVTYHGEKAILSIARDITERKNVEKNLNEKTALFEAQVNASPDGILVIDENQKRIIVNKKIVELFDVSNDIMDNDDDTLLLNHVVSLTKYPDKFFEKVMYLYNHPQETSFDEVEFKSGMVLQRYSAPVLGYDGKYYGRIWTFRDITDRKKAEKALIENELKYQMIFKSMSQGFYLSQILYDENGIPCDYKFIDANSAFGEIIGLKLEQIIGKTYNELVPPDPKSGWLNCFKRVAMTGIPENYTFPSKIYNCYFEVYAFISDEGKFCALVKDITERKKIENTLRENTALLEAQLNSSIEGILVVDANGKKILQNKRTVELWRIPQDIADNPDDSMQVKHVMQMTKYPEQFFEKVKYLYNHPNEIIRDEVELINGTILDRYSAPVLGYDGRYYGRIWAFRDITERKLAVEEIKNLNEELENKVKERTRELEIKNNELESFSYSVSHDLRAPLRHISFFSELLFDEIKLNINDTSKKYIDNIINASKKMNILIENLLAFSRMSLISINFKKVKMNDLLKEVIKFLSDEMINSKIKWIIKDLPIVMCDLPMIRQVLINLLQNAVKYSKNVKKAIIEIGYTENEKENIFYVKDNGVGFDEKYKDKLFGVFQRLHSDKDFSGNGIGLALVKKIVTRHGGSVWAESKSNEGAAFYFSLPKKSAKIKK